MLSLTELSLEERQRLTFHLRSKVSGFEYREKPADIEQFVMDKEYLNLSESIRPAVLKDLEDLFCDKYSFAFCPYEEAVFDEAVGSGKTFKTSIIISYLVHHILCMENAQKTFGLDQHSMIAIMNMSVNGTQAKKVVFGETKARIDNSPWFQKNKPDPNIRSELRFPGNITIIPGHSGSTFPLGYNLIGAVMDEAAYYTETSTHDVASELFYTLQRRIKTRFGKHGLLVMISQPRYVDDFIEKKAAEGDNDEAIFVRRRAIWEVKQEDIAQIEAGECFILSDGRVDVKIPNCYKKDFDKNPMKAWRDLGGRPALSLQPYLKQWDKVLPCFDELMQSPTEKIDNVSGDEIVFKDWFRGKEDVSYYIHIDLGLSKDKAGICMGHAEGQMAILDLLIRIKAPADGEIELAEVERLVFMLKKDRGFELEKVTYDQFQSARSIQELRNNDIDADRKSVEDIDSCETFKEKLYLGCVRTYPNEPFRTEMQRLELVKGKKVDHPVHGSKDMWDGATGVVNHLEEHEMEAYAEVETL